MDDIILLQMPTFKKAYKKLHTKDNIIVDNAIRMIMSNPALGQEKKGDLASVYVYTFKLHQQEMLLAYEWDIKTRTLIALGVHKNFYRDLKR
ncbi:MAG: type II toxin-antitoxin system RelE/ParE family toxin [Gammaproteobacteria bacterium]